MLTFNPLFLLSFPAAGERFLRIKMQRAEAAPIKTVGGLFATVLYVDNMSTVSGPPGLEWLDKWQDAWLHERGMLHLMADWTWQTHTEQAIANAAAALCTWLMPPSCCPLPLLVPSC